MSSLMRPSGRLPARVYWVRRLLVFAVVVLVVAVVWWLLNGRAGSKPTGSGKPDASLSGLAATSSAPRQVSAAPTTGAQASTTGHAPRHHREPGRHGRRGGSTSRAPLPPPTGTCSPTDVTIAIRVPDTKVGEAATATLSLTTVDGAVCTLQITPASLVLRVTSGTDVVWTSDDCPNLLPARQIVVRGEPAATYSWTWDGRRSVQGCESPGALPSPGGYWVEAALVGADVHKGYFDVRA